jgi:hypothetical protein
MTSENTGAEPVSLSPTYPEAVRQLDRLADRLRVVGPRLAARDGEQAAELLRSIRAGLQQLADLAADADRLPRRAVPELAGYALADQALVLGHDLLTDRTDPFRAVALDTIRRIQRLI